MSPNASRNAGAVVARNLVEKRPRAIQDLSDIAVYLAFEKYLIFYRWTRSGVEIVRVLQAKRDIEALFRNK